MTLPDAKRCSGCGACRSACVTDALCLRPDGNGFLHPVIDAKTCVHCGLCERACPVLVGEPVRFPIQCFAALSKNNEIRLESSSGGLFTEFAHPVLARGGVVYGCVWNSDLEPCHVRTESEDGLVAMRGSKYIQSNSRLVYRDVKEDLNFGREVLFSGTPCQIAGLRKFLGTVPANLFTLAIICHGVMSPVVFAGYRHFVERKTGEKLVSIRFRKKVGSWKKSLVSCLFSNGVGSVDECVYDNLYFRTYDYSMRRSCYACHFRNGRSGCDVMIGDFWGIENVCPRMDDDLGTSCVLVYSKKGLDAFRKLDVVCSEVVLKDVVVPRNPNVESDVILSFWRTPFLILNRLFGIQFAWDSVSFLRRAVATGKKVVLSAIGCFGGHS